MLQTQPGWLGSSHTPRPRAVSCCDGIRTATCFRFVLLPPGPGSQRRQPGELQSFLLCSPYLVLAHQGEQLRQKEPSICERSFAHTQGKRVALYHPSPRQNAHLEKSHGRPGCSSHQPLSRVPGLFCTHASAWLLRWFRDWALHHSPKAFCTQ